MAKREAEGAALQPRIGKSLTKKKQRQLKTGGEKNHCEVGRPERKNKQNARKLASPSKKTHTFKTLSVGGNVKRPWCQTEREP